MSILFVVFFWLTNALSARAQTSDAVADLATRINSERLSRGLVPLALNAKLNAAAQGHADDIARTTNYGHTGSDGSTATDRIARAGYGKYSWGYRVGENWAWYHSVAEAMAMWMDSTPHRNNILHQLSREMGIGVAPTSPGGFIYVVDFGAQPNVLPIFINDGADETRSPDVKITLSNEDVMPNGDGENVIGHPVEVQVSNTADFLGKWQPYAQNVNWTLSSSGGTKMVYVRYHDAKGRTATASNSIVYMTAGMPTATKLPPTRTATSMLRATVAATFTPLPTETPTETPTLAATEAVSVEMPMRVFATSEVAEAASPGPTRPSPSSETVEANGVPDFAALGFFGISVMLAVLTMAKYCRSLG